MFIQNKLQNFRVYIILIQYLLLINNKICNNTIGINDYTELLSSCLKINDDLIVCHMRCEPLTLDHQSILTNLWKPLCQSHELQFAEYSFANVYLFRRQHSYVFVDTTPPQVIGEFKTGHYYLIPTTVPAQMDLENLRYKTCKTICFFPIPNQWIDRFDKTKVSINSSRNDFDYLFKTNKLKTLSGRALSSRRNLLNQLKTNYTLESRPLNALEIINAQNLLEAWQMQSGLSKDKTDYLPCREALGNMERLGLFGYIAYADGQPIGFTIGEQLTSTTVLVMFAKSLHSFKGVTPFLYQDFASHLPAEVEWINLEQDLGIPALRQAKEAYAPDLLLPKWKVCL